MTKKELVQQLKQNMPEFSGSKVEKEKKIAMYVYLELGKKKSFDEKFFFSKPEVKERILRLKKITKYYISPVVKNRKINCLTLSNLYRSVLKDFNIKCSTKKITPTSIHYYNIITLSDGTKITADLQQDLDNIQTRCKTQLFGGKYENGNVIESAITDDELFQIHKECGYVQNKSDYMDFKIQKLAENLKGLPVNQILYRILNDEEINKYSKDMEYIEFYRYYTKLVNKIVPLSNQSSVNYFNCYRRKENAKNKDEKEYSMCIYSVCDNKVDAYLYSKTDKKFKQVDLETFEKLEQQGLFLGSTPKEKGAEKFRDCMNRMIVNRYKSRD